MSQPPQLTWFYVGMSNQFVNEIESDQLRHNYWEILVRKCIFILKRRIMSVDILVVHTQPYLQNYEDKKRRVFCLRLNVR